MHHCHSHHAGKHGAGRGRSRARRHRRRRGGGPRFEFAFGRGFGPWSQRGRFFGPGEVRLALLSLLAEAPQHGYQLMRGLEERSGGLYRASAGSVYPTLQQLEDEGHVESEREGGKRIYRITESGRGVVEAEAAHIEEIWHRAEDWGSWDGLQDPAAAELMRPAMRLFKTALRSLARSQDPLRVDDIRDVLDKARADIEDLDRSG